MMTVTVRIFAADTGTRDEAVASLSAHADITVVSPYPAHEPDVLLVIATHASEPVLRSIELAFRGWAPRPPRVVMVTESIGPRQLMRAVNAGLVFLLDPRSSDFDKIARAVLLAGMIMTTPAAGYRVVPAYPVACGKDVAAVAGYAAGAPADCIPHGGTGP